MSKKENAQNFSEFIQKVLADNSVDNSVDGNLALARVNLKKKVTWKVGKNPVSGSVSDCVKKFKEDIKAFKQHIPVNDKEFKDLKEKSSDLHGTVNIDHSEKFNDGNKSKVSLFTAVCWVNCVKTIYTFISDIKTAGNHHATCLFLHKIFVDIKIKYPNLKEIDLFSDSEFKNKSMIPMLIPFQKAFGFKLGWNFFAPQHYKKDAYEVWKVIRRKVHDSIKDSSESMSTIKAIEFHKKAQESHCSAPIGVPDHQLIYTAEEEIDAWKPELKMLFKDDTDYKIKDIKKYHRFEVKDAGTNIITARVTSSGDGTDKDIDGNERFNNIFSTRLASERN